MTSRSGRWARDRWRPEEEARRDSRPHSNAPRDNNHRPESDTASPSLRSPANETIGFGSPHQSQQHPQQHQPQVQHHQQHQSHYDSQPPAHGSRHQDRHQQDRHQQDRHHQDRHHQDRHHQDSQPSHSQPPSNMGSRVTSGSAPPTPLPAPVVPSSSASMQAMLPPPPPPCFPTPQSSPEELEGYRLWYDKYATLYQQYMQYQAQMEQQQQPQPTPPRSMDRQFSSNSAPSGELRQHRDYDPRDAPRAQYEDPRGDNNSRAVDSRDPRDMREGQTQDQRRDAEMERRARQDAGRITKTHEQYTGEVKLAESKTLRLYCPVTPLEYTEQYDRFDPEALNPARNQRDAMDAIEGRVPAQQSAHRSKAQQAEERYREYANTFTSGFVHNALYRCHPLEYQDGDHIARKQRLEEEGANNRQRKHKKNADPDTEIAEVMDPSARRALVDDEGHDAVVQYHGRFRSGPSLAESHEAEQVLNRRRGQPTQPFTTIAAAQEAYEAEQAQNVATTHGLIDQWRDITRRETSINVQQLYQQKRNPIGSAASVSDESNRYSCAPRVDTATPAYHHPTGPVKRALSWETLPMNPLVGVSGHEPACLMRIQNRPDTNDFDNGDDREDKRGGRRQEGGNNNNFSSHHQQGGVRRGGEPSYQQKEASPFDHHSQNDTMLIDEGKNYHQHQQQHQQQHHHQQQHKQQHQQNSNFQLQFQSHELPSHFDLVPSDELHQGAPRPPQPPINHPTTTTPTPTPTTNQFKMPLKKTVPAKSVSVPHTKTPIAVPARNNNNAFNNNSASNNNNKNASQPPAVVIPAHNRTVPLSVAAAVRAAFEAKSASSGMSAQNSNRGAPPPNVPSQRAPPIVPTTTPIMQQQLGGNGGASIRIGGARLHEPSASQAAPIVASTGFRPLPSKAPTTMSSPSGSRGACATTVTPGYHRPRSPPAETSQSPMNDQDSRDKKRERNQAKEAKKTTALEELKELYHYYCEPCQKGFQSEGTYKEHLKLHINCPYEGCNFFCKQDWKLNMHISTLHRHPNAPDLSDTSKYIEQRKGNFPTNDRIKGKIEELYYRAARGELLPREKIRWLKRQGIDLKKPLGPQLKTLGTKALKGKGGSGDEIIEDASGLVRDAEEGGSSTNSDDEEDEEENAKRELRLSSALVAPVGAAAVLASHHVGVSTKEQEALFDRAGPPPPPPPRCQVLDDEDDEDMPRSDVMTGKGSRASSRQSVVAEFEEDVPRPSYNNNNNNANQAEVDDAPSSSPNRHHLASSSSASPPQPPWPTNRELGKAVASITASMREKATKVPIYYVCPKCTKKGDHWAIQCPSTSAGAAASAAVSSPSRFATTTPASPQGPTSSSPQESSARQSVLCTDDKDVEEPPATKGFRPIVRVGRQARGEAAVNKEQLNTHREAFSDAAQAAHELRAQSKALLKLKPTQQKQPQKTNPIPPSPHGSPSSNCSSTNPTALASSSSATRRAQVPPPPMNLYDKLVSDERTMDHSLLLQAFRYFVHEDFFGDAEFAAAKRPRT